MYTWSSTFRAITSFTKFNDRSRSRCFYSLSNSTFAFFLTVRPDPPVSLNWTLLNISPSGLSYDVMVNWEPPPSADVMAGWMRLEYEIQYRERNTTPWEAVSRLFFYLIINSLSSFFAFMHTHVYMSGHMKKYTLKLTKKCLCAIAQAHTNANNHAPSLK